MPGRYLSLPSTIHTHRESSSLLVAFLDPESKGFVIGNFCGEWNSDNIARRGERGRGREK